MEKSVRGNALTSITESIGYGSDTQGSETSQYLQEEKSKEIPSVVANESGTAQTSRFTYWGCGTQMWYC